MRKTIDGRRIPINVVGSSTYGRYNKVSSAKTYNMYMSKGGKNEDDFWLVNTAGYQKIYDLLPNGIGRGIFASIRGNIIIAIVNSSVYSLDVNFNPTLIGMLATVNGEVFIDENLNSQICIVDGVNAYIYNYSLPANLTIQVGLGNLIPNFVEYHNTFFLFGNGDRTTNGAAWYAFQYATPTTIVIATPGQFALQTKPDFALAVVRLPGQANNVLVLGEAVCEVWTQVGGVENYRRNNTINIDYGCISISTISRSDNFVAWLAINEYSAPVIRIYSGQESTPISSMGIDYDLSIIKHPSESTGMFLMQDGHLMYQLTFYNPEDNLTLLFDFTTKQFFHLSDAHLNYHPARNYIYFNGVIYFISLNNASIYESSTDITTYNENILNAAVQDPALNMDIQRIRICDTIQEDDSAQFRVNNFVFTMEQGIDPLASALAIANNEDLLIAEDSVPGYDNVIYAEFGPALADEDSGGAGLAPGQPNNNIPYIPRVDLSISRDGGITWSNTVGRDLNPLGFRQNIINWSNMGICNSLTFKLRFWGMDRFVVNNGVVDIYQ